MGNDNLGVDCEAEEPMMSVFTGNINSIIKNEPNFSIPELEKIEVNENSSSDSEVVAEQANHDNIESKLGNGQQTQINEQKIDKDTGMNDENMSTSTQIRHRIIPTINKPKNMMVKTIFYFHPRVPS